jgi:hypothetical protein
MGLLDDAIREHLELKRLRGADPGDVAKDEREALGHVPGEVGMSPGREGGSEDIDRPVSGDEPADSSMEGQETVEINMAAELAAGVASEGKHEARRAEAVSPGAHTEASSEEPLEWEVPSDRREAPLGQGPSKDIADHHAEADLEGAGLLEDVLEETPDFLRETPEQERLWFEQRPPRDFDFNE